MNRRLLMMAAAAAWLAAGALADITLYSPEADTLATVTARGATSAQSLTLTGSTPLTLGADAATNTAGWLKLWGAGGNDFYTTITAGTQTQNVAYTMPADDGTSGQALSTDGSGALSWSTFVAAEADTLATVTARGATAAVALVLDDGAGDSPAVEWVCAGDKKLALSKLDAGDGLVLNDEGGLQLQLSNDTDDYLVLSTAADVPTIATAGACNLTIAPDGGTTNVTGALAASGDLTGNGGLGVDLISQAVAVADFTDNTDATGYIDLTPKLPAGAIVLGWECVVTAGFTGDTSATVQVGVEGTLDKYSATTANSVLVDDTTVGSSVKDGNVYCAAVTTVRVTVTGDADFTSIKTANHGAMTVKVFYICTP